MIIPAATTNARSWRTGKSELSTDPYTRAGEVAEDPGAHADARKRAAGQKHPASELSSRDPRAGPPSPAVTLEQVSCVDDRPPRQDVAPSESSARATALTGHRQPTCSRLSSACLGSGSSLSTW